MAVTLSQILSTTRSGLEVLRVRRGELEREAEQSPVPASLARSLRRSNVAVIAEVKRRSPSAGSIREDLSPPDQALLYATHGAAAVSILTDTPHFGGSVDDLRRTAPRCPVPLLRKDFILDELQIVEARAAGASAILLIVRALSPARLKVLMGTAAELSLDALVEVHTAAELDIALEAEATIIGVNSRDLDTFTVNRTAAWRIIQDVPRDRIAVAESGIASREDVERAGDAGADAVLVGTALSASAHPEALLQQLARVPRRER
jgi:indole-3-glycerol phosphate synthase